MDNIEELCNSMVGLSFDIRGEDYGRIMRWVRVEKNDRILYVFVTSLGKKVEATGVIDYVRNTVRYPKETDPNRNKIKPKRRAGYAFPSGISTMAYFRDNVKTRALPHEKQLNNELTRKDK